MPLYTPPTALLLFGSGQDGALTFNGSDTVLGLAPSGNTYTLTRDIYATTCTISSGVTIVNRGFRIFCSVALNNAGTISANGNDASGSTGGASVSAAGTYQCIGAAGATGRNTTGAGTAGAGSGGSNVGGAASGAGGQADAGNAGGAANSTASPSANSGGFNHIWPWLWGRAPGATAASNPVVINGGGSGGSGGANVGTGTATSGGGGGNGFTMGIFTKTLNNTGTISANGGGGGNASVTGDGKAGGGGGGAAGSLCVATSRVVSLGTITANGGTGGSGAGGGSNGATGGNGLALVITG
jgi:hypothetical protein